MLPTNLRSILTVIAVAVTVSANPSPKLIGCVDVVDIKTGEITKCVPLSKLANGQDSNNNAKHQGGHARKKAADENNLCVNLKYNNNQSPSTATTAGPDQNRCVSFPTLRDLQASYQYQNTLMSRSDEGDNNAAASSNEPCMDIYYLDPKDNVTITGRCIPITDLDKYEKININYQHPPDDDPHFGGQFGEEEKQKRHLALSQNRDMGPAKNYTFCTEPYDVFQHVAYGSPIWSDCIMIAANAIQRSRSWTWRASKGAHSLLSVKTCELALRTTGTLVTPGTVLKIGNKDIERTYLAGIKAINDMPKEAGGKQQLIHAQGFELEGKFKCWDNTESEHYLVYFGYMLKGAKPQWWEGMGTRG